MQLNDILPNVFENIKKTSREKPWGTISCKVGEGFFLSEFVAAIDNTPRMRDADHPVLFRGQSNAEWELIPKFVRLWLPFLSDMNQLAKIKKDALEQELDSIYYFQERAIRHLPEARGLQKKLDYHTVGEWMSIMQHYKAPTRFLDWTTSFYVALFFAVNDDTKDGAVWHFGTHELIDAMNAQTTPIDEQEYILFLKDYTSYVDYGMTAQKRIEIYGSDLKTDRMMMQRGVFTFSHDIFSNHAFDIGSSLLNNKKSPLMKMIIPSTMKKDIRCRLFKMNISTETLFPCIDSVGLSIEEKLRLYQDTFLRT